MNEFSKILRDLIQRSGKSIPRLEEDSGVDAAYIRKLASGQKRHPSHLTVVKLMIGLVADHSLVDRDPRLLQHGLGELLNAMFGDAVAGD